MSTFALKTIEAVKGKQQFYELLIDGYSQYEEFTNEVAHNPQYKSELLTILSYMNFVANLKLLPDKKFKDITPTKDATKEYEFKSAHLRTYVFHCENIGKIVAYFGYKNCQKEDIVKFRSIKRRYLKSIIK